MAGKKKPQPPTAGRDALSPKPALIGKADAFSGKLLVESIRQPGNNYDIYALDQKLDEFAGDGFGSLMTGPAFAKFCVVRSVDLAVEGDTAVEVRQIVGRIVVPAPALIDFCWKVLAGLAGQRANLVDGRSKETAKMVEQLGRFAEMMEAGRTTAEAIRKGKEGSKKNG